MSWLYLFTFAVFIAAARGGHSADIANLERLRIEEFKGTQGLSDSMGPGIPPKLPTTVWNKAQQNTALTYLLFSYAAYCLPREILAWNCRWCQKIDGKVTNVKLRMNGTDGSLVYSALVNGTVVVSFMGTHNIQSVIKDLDVEPITIPGTDMAIHSGFLESYRSLMGGLQKDINELCSMTGNGSSCQLQLVGHSLGGALSVMLAADIFAPWSGLFTSPHAIEVLPIYTFGAPRIGNGAWADFVYSRVNTSLIRVVNRKDLVPHLPPMDLGYVHSPSEVWALNGNYYVCSGTNGEDASCSDSLKFPINVYDHLSYFGLPEDCPPQE